MRLLQSDITKCVNRQHLPYWLGRCLTTEAPHLSENIEKSFVTGPLTMLSEEEEMMKETGIDNQMFVTLLKLKHVAISGKK